MPETPRETHMWYIWHWALTSAYSPPLTRPSHLNSDSGILLTSYMGKSTPGLPNEEGKPKLFTSCLLLISCSDFLGSSWGSGSEGLETGFFGKDGFAGFWNDWGMCCLRGNWCRGGWLKTGWWSGGRLLTGKRGWRGGSWLKKGCLGGTWLNWGGTPAWGKIGNCLLDLK